MPPYVKLRPKHPLEVGRFYRNTRNCSSPRKLLGDDGEYVSYAEIRGEDKDDYYTGYMTTRCFIAWITERAESLDGPWTKA